MQAGWKNDLGRAFALLAGGAALSLLPACSKSSGSDQQASEPAVTMNTASATDTAAATPTAAPAAAAPAPDNVDTVSGVKFAAYTGDAAKGEKVFVQCKTCHTIEAGVNHVGPSLHAVVGRHAGIIPNFHYSNSNKNSGIVWTEPKLFQYLEGPQRVVPGTFMTFTGVKDPQQRADVIAYLKSNS